MNNFEIILIAVGLAMDAFAVAVSSSVVIGRVTARQVFRLGFHFGLFQALMPILGWLAGRTVRQDIEAWDHWLAFALLAFIGSKAIYGACRSDATNKNSSDPTRGFNLLFLSTATSIDALAVGISFAMLGVSVWYPSAVIGVVTALLTAGGVLLGGRLGLRFGKRIEAGGGAVLILIGVKILLSHLL